jgi:thymidylate kinase
MTEEPPLPVVGVVGPCCAGKSTLIRALRALGYPAKHIAQEHSYAPRMWQIIGQPNVLIYLDVSYPVAQQRRWMNWQPADLDEQNRRLRHAREHCDLCVETDSLTVDEVREITLKFLGGNSE